MTLRRLNKVPLNKMHFHLPASASLRISAPRRLGGLPLTSHAPQQRGLATSMEVVESVAACREALLGLSRDSRGAVFTMGGLHEGHLSLVRAAKARNEAVVASIFVNPKQFAAGEDLAAYPRTLERDLELLHGEGVDLVFAPPAEEMYPPGFATVVDPGPHFSGGGGGGGGDGGGGSSSAGGGEGGARPHFFRGVATVCTRLLNLVQPTHAYFGQKDAMQCAVLRRIVADLMLPTEVVVVPTARDALDGLALSSRNAYLDADERRAAPAVYAALRAGAAAYESLNRRRSSSSILPSSEVRTAVERAVRRALAAPGRDSFLLREDASFSSSTSLALAADWTVEYVSLAAMGPRYDLREVPAVGFGHLPLSSHAALGGAVVTNSGSDSGSSGSGGVGEAEAAADEEDRELNLSLAVRTGNGVRLIDNVVLPAWTATREASVSTEHAEASEGAAAAAAAATAKPEIDSRDADAKISASIAMRASRSEVKHQQQQQQSQPQPQPISQQSPPLSAPPLQPRRRPRSEQRRRARKKQQAPRAFTTLDLAAAARRRRQAQQSGGAAHVEGGAEMRRLTMVTAYSFPMAKHVAAAGADLVLVGDSLGMVELGHATTTPVTVDDMLRAAAAVRRGVDSTVCRRQRPRHGESSSSSSGSSSSGGRSSKRSGDGGSSDGGTRPMVVVDLPFGSYELGPTQALATAQRFVKEAGADAVKLEGGAHMADTVAALVRGGVPVVSYNKVKCSEMK